MNVKEIGGTKEICAGENYLMIVHNSGKVEGFGKIKFGQMGTGTSEDIKERDFITTLENVEGIACGESHTIFKNYKGTSLWNGFK